MNNVILITGAAQGLGLVIAQHFAEANYKVVLTDVTLALAEQAASGLSGQVLPLKLDVRHKEDFDKALADTVKHFGHLDILVNNAAMTPTTPLLDIPPEEFTQVVDINLKGTFLGCQVVGPHLAAQKRGRIINMASLAGQMGGTASGAHYASSKAGILTLTKIFARQFAPDGVTVNAIAPGPVDVDSVREKVPAEKLEHIINNAIPMKTLSDPVFIAKMILLLTEEQANSVTGATWDVNGGVYMR